MTEIAFALKAVATLVSTLKKTPSANGKFMQIILLALHVLYETIIRYVIVLIC